FVCVLLAGTVLAQKSKPWNEWSKKDADKMLNDSAWGQSQTKSDAPPNISKSVNEGKQAGVPRDTVVSTDIYVRARFITARPIREAFARRILLEQPNASQEVQDQVKAFVERNFGDLIVVAVN